MPTPASDLNRAADAYNSFVHYATGLLWLNGRDKEVIAALTELIVLPPTPSAPAQCGGRNATEQVDSSVPRPRHTPDHLERDQPR
jgi:hypothetical protein